jgi:hypothetical protein
MPRSLDERNREDFEFLVTAHAVGDPAIYALFRDHTLDADNEAARKAKQPATEQSEIDMAIRD